MPEVGRAADPSQLPSTQVRRTTTGAGQTPASTTEAGQTPASTTEADTTPASTPPVSVEDSAMIRATAALPTRELAAVPVVVADVSDADLYGDFNLMSGSQRTAERRARYCNAINEGFQDGVLTRAEYEKAIGHDINDTQWKTLTGGSDTVTSRLQLHKGQEQVNEFLQGTGQQFYTWADAGIVTTMPNGRDLQNIYSNMTYSDKIIFVQNNRDPLGHRFDGMPDDEVVESLEEMLGEHGGYQLRQILYGVINSMATEMQRANLSTVPLINGLVASKYTRETAEEYMLSGTLPTAEQFSAYARLDETVNQMRALYGSELGSRIDNIDTEATRFDEIFDRIRDTLNEENMPPQDKRAKIDELLVPITRDQRAVPTGR
jgi:hypothetical protein